MCIRDRTRDELYLAIDHLVGEPPMFESYDYQGETIQEGRLSGMLATIANKIRSAKKKIGKRIKLGRKAKGLDSIKENESPKYDANILKSVADTYASMQNYGIQGDIVEETQLDEVKRQEVDAMKKVSKDMQKVLVSYQKIANMGDKELKNTIHNKSYKQVLDARDSILKMIGTLNTKMILRKEGTELNEEVILYRIKDIQKPELDKFKSSARLMKLKINIKQSPMKKDTLIRLQGSKKQINDFDAVVRGKSSYGDPSVVEDAVERAKELADLKAKHKREVEQEKDEIERTKQSASAESVLAQLDALEEQIDLLEKQYAIKPDMDWTAPATPKYRGKHSRAKKSYGVDKEDVVAMIRKKKDGKHELAAAAERAKVPPVSYTHLTLPTIYSV